MTGITVPDPGAKGSDRDPVPLRPLDVLVVAVCLALLSGVLDAAQAAFRLLVLKRIIWSSQDFVWMIPLAYVLCFLVPALGLALLSLPLRKWITLRLAVGLFAFLGVFALLLPYTEIARYASALIAAGVGVQLTRTVGSSPARWLGRMRRGAAVMAISVALAGIVVRAARWLEERVALSRLPAPPGDAPSVLLVILDTVRRGNLTVYGYARETTPNLSRRAAEGVVFDYAMSTAPWTLPSHGSIFTGQYPGQLSGSWRTPMDGRHQTLASTLQEHGFLTGGFVGNLLYTSYESGLGRGFIHYDDYPVSLKVLIRHCPLGRTPVVTSLLDSRSFQDVRRALSQVSLKLARVPADEVRTARQITDAILQWQSRYPGRPFFAFLNYIDAHGRYAEEPFRSRFGSPGIWQDRYDGSIAYVDAQVGRLLDQLQHRGVLDRTLVIITADHGEHLGERGLRGHGNSLYLSLLQVPLIIRFPPGVPAGRRIDRVVSLRDLAATVLDLTGIRDEGRIPGVTLSRYWRSTPPIEPNLVFAEVTKRINVDSAFPNAHDSLKTLLDDRFQYIRAGKGTEELYAYRTDSLEQVNLTSSPIVEADLKRFRQLLTTFEPAPMASGR